MLKWELAWVAGILEGEGTFYIDYKGSNPQIKVNLAMMDEDVVQEVFDIVKIGRFYGPSKKGMWTWQINKQTEAAAFMMTIYPLMRDRRKEKIKACLKEWKSFPYMYQRPCPRGHRVEDGSFYVASSGGRVCRVCEKSRVRRDRIKD
jgi:hypothetical protein